MTVEALETSHLTHIIYAGLLIYIHDRHLDDKPQNINKLQQRLLGSFN